MMTTQLKRVEPPEHLISVLRLNTPQVEKMSTRPDFREFFERKRRSSEAMNQYRRSNYNRFTVSQPYAYPNRSHYEYRDRNSGGGHSNIKARSPSDYLIFDLDYHKIIGTTQKSNSDFYAVFPVTIKFSKIEHYSENKYWLKPLITQMYILFQSKYRTYMKIKNLLKSTIYKP